MVAMYQGCGRPSKFLLTLYQEYLNVVHDSPDCDMLATLLVIAAAHFTAGMLTTYSQFSP